MFKDLPIDAQEKIKSCLNDNDFVSAKKIYDSFKQHS